MTVQLSYTELGPSKPQAKKLGKSMGQPIVILHGLFGSKRNWGAIAKALSSHHRVFSLDLRNHGESEWADTMTYEALAADVAKFIHQHDLAPCTVLGHSMGGKTAMILALRQPKMISRLVVVDIAPVPRETDIGAYIQVMKDVPLVDCKTRKDVEEHLTHAIVTPTIRQFLLQNLTRDGESFRWRLNLKALEAGMPDIANFPPVSFDVHYPGPTHFIIGGKSDYVLSHHMDTIRMLFPQTTTTTIAEAGHWVHAEAPDEFLATLNEFLEKTEI
ncbi:MAG: alpha/beta fold hydrolase [Magnetovibrio sp.]|nr:alpha/beta fold hydrolase [Magnetovibrio sp.]